jgi:hypothetical protein
MEKALEGEKSIKIEHNLVNNRKTRENFLFLSFYLRQNPSLATILLTCVRKVHRWKFDMTYA